MPTVAVRLGERRKLDIRRDNHLKVVTAAIAKLGEGRMLEVATQEVGIGKLAMRRNKLRPERRLVWAIAHAPNETELSRAAESALGYLRECCNRQKRSNCAGQRRLQRLVRPDNYLRGR